MTVPFRTFFRIHPSSSRGTSLVQSKVVSRGRLRSLGLEAVAMDNEGLEQLRLIYDSNIILVGQHHPNTVLTDLIFGYNDIEGFAGGNHLQRLLLTLPCLKKFKMIFCDSLGPDGARALFSHGMVSVMGRLQSLSMADCLIGNAGVAQMVASMPDGGAAAPLVYLDLAGNEITGGVGGDHLLGLLRRCKHLETLDLARNEDLGPNGARALAPVFSHLGGLKKLRLPFCGLQDGTTTILASFATASPCLKSLDLMGGDLPVTSLASLTNFLKWRWRSLS